MTGPRVREEAPPDVCAVRVVDPERVDAVRDRLIGPEEAARLANLFKMLGYCTRTRLLYELLEAGELCVCDLAASVSASETSVSHALRLLRAAGIVRNRRDGRIVYYRLADAHVRLLLDLSAEHIRHDV
ncbi:MAG: ArsR/SmtB family transcription factor, partial [Actinomycetota bacterium]